MDADHDDELPAEVAAAWGLTERAPRGPKRALTVAGIVEAAIRLADAEGLPAVSMSRVAAEIGAGTMALYRYVSAKDELLALMTDAAFGPAPAAASAAEGWRAGLSRWAWTYLRVLREHRWIVRIPISGPPILPRGVAWFESGLASLRHTDLLEGEKVSTILLLSGLVRNEATLLVDLARAAEQPTASRVMLSYGKMITALTDPVRFPALHAVAAAGVFEGPDDPDVEFTFALDRTLDGIEALVRHRGRGARHTPSRSTDPLR